jgi:hypothetical protein
MALSRSTAARPVAAHAPLQLTGAPGGLFLQCTPSAASFHDRAARRPQPTDVRTQAVRHRVIVAFVPAKTSYVVAAGALLLWRPLMLCQGCTRQRHDRQHGNSKSSYHPILLNFKSARLLVLRPRGAFFDREYASVEIRLKSIHCRPTLHEADKCRGLLQRSTGGPPVG